MKLEINIGKTHMYVIISLFVIIVGMITVVALTPPSTPNINGHSVDEIHGAARSCEANPDYVNCVHTMADDWGASATAIAASQAKLIPGVCVLAVACPTGWVDKGTIGIIYNNPDLAKNPFSTGGAYNAWWTWSHSKLCCYS